MSRRMSNGSFFVITAGIFVCKYSYSPSPSPSDRLAVAILPRCVQSNFSWPSSIQWLIRSGNNNAVTKQWLLCYTILSARCSQAWSTEHVVLFSSLYISTVQEYTSSRNFTRDFYNPVALDVRLPWYFHHDHTIKSGEFSTTISWRCRFC